MQLDPQEVSAMKNAVANAKKVLTISHKSPDGDTTGAALAWRFAFQDMGKEVVSFCVDTLPPKYSYIPESAKFTKDMGDIHSYDLIVITDLGDIKLTGLPPEINEKLLSTGKVLNVDHHPTNTKYGTINFVFIDAASATEIVYYLLKALNVHITPMIATSIMNGLYTDTGSFMHDNVTPQTLHVASQMISFGADYASVVYYNFKLKPVSTLNLWGRVLDRMKMNDKGITSSAVTEEDFSVTQAAHSELEGVVDYLNSVPETKFSILLSERGNIVKGSLRTPRNDIDLTEIAGIFGGGGHKKASGFAVPGKLSQEGDKWKIEAAF